MGAEEEIGVTWGTWEELPLGGAVLRHGTADWNTVAAELRARALRPYVFTPEVCRVKYEDLQQRYSGCTAWFDELRKKRMAELRHALEVSQDSIGSLESRLETLKSESGGESRVNYASSRTESPITSQKSEGFELFSKDYKDGLSAGSFTIETGNSWSAECQIPSSGLAEETDTKPEVLRSSDHGRISIAKKLEVNGRNGAMLKKRRGQRKRKDCSKEVKESSVGDCGLLDSADAMTTVRSKENSTSDCAEVSGSSGLDNQSRGPKDGIDDLLKVFNSIVEHKCASTFRHRLDSQKRGRYKKMIRKHMDFDTLRSRITSRSIVSVKELFRDLLLLANNALVFYSKSTREHKSAMLLRDLTFRTLHCHFSIAHSTKPASPNLLAPKKLVHTCPPKARASQVHSAKKNFPTKTTNLDTDDVVRIHRNTKVGRKSNTREQNASPVKGRKRSRTK